MQTVDLDKLPSQRKSKREPRPNADNTHRSGGTPVENAKHLTNRNAVFLTQYHPRGTLDKFAILASTRGKALSNPTLWFMFDCCKSSPATLKFNRLNPKKCSVPDGSSLALPASILERFR